MIFGLYDDYTPIMVEAIQTSGSTDPGKRGATHMGATRIEQTKSVFVFAVPVERLEGH